MSGVTTATAPPPRATAPGAGLTAALVTAAGVLACAAFALPLTGESPYRWQVALAVIGVVNVVLVPWARHALVIAAVAAVVSAGLSLVDTEATLVGTAAAGVAAFASFEAASLARMWRSVGVLDRAAEGVHLRAVAVRTGIGAAVAATCTVLGLLDLPASGVAAAAGVVAAVVVIIGAALRATGAEAPADPDAPSVAPPPPPPPGGMPRTGQRL